MSGSVEPVLVLKGLLKARLRVDYEMDNMQGFSHIWAVGGVLCSVGGGDGELNVSF